ncbi:hypothetical protein NDU88_002901 [Pleurodeles waltl]|uniref:Uncharacterized protein n=1 Tax=Pleurodeles waltl TaxID=8319 RepID=A0AAV7TLY8_PLEWA|nr:hypothetical protein NDU88_002901 [Pleurodeles waltl]
MEGAVCSAAQDHYPEQRPSPGHRVRLPRCGRIGGLLSRRPWLRLVSVLPGAGSAPGPLALSAVSVRPTGRLGALGVEGTRAPEFALS